jgi:hypothetical protein
MEEEIIQLLKGPGVTARILAEKLFSNFSQIEVEDELFPLFFKFGLDHSLLPEGKSLQDIASLFDQLINLVAATSLHRESEATFIVQEEGL